MLLQRYRRGRVAILYYHNPDPDVLARHLRYLSGKYKFTTIDAIADGRLPKCDERSGVIVTIDDGRAGNYKLLPVLQHYSVRPTIYLCTGIVDTKRRFWWQAVASAFVRRELMQIADADRKKRLRDTYGFDEKDEWPGERAALSKSEILEMSDYADFGAHTRFHPILPRCEDSICLSEISVCRKEVEDLSGRPCRHFAFPNGNYGRREDDMTRRCGYQTTRTTDWGWIRSEGDKFLLKSIHIPDDASVPMLLGQLSGLGEIIKLAGEWQRKMLFALRSIVQKTFRNFGS